LKIKTVIQKPVRRWFPKESGKVTADMRTGVAITEEKNQRETASVPLWFGLSFVVGFIFIFITWLGRYRSLWSVMAEGAIIGLIFGSLIGIEGARVSLGTNQVRPRPRFGFVIVAAFLIGFVFTGSYSSYYLFYQEGLIHSELFLLLINCSFGFFASVFLAEGLTERYILSRRRHRHE
jgi:hypothetical protein